MAKGRKPKKNPWLAAVLNLLIFGLGYVYAGKRAGFGIGLVLTDVILGTYITSMVLQPMVWVYLTIMSLLFAYDGYKTAEEANGGK